MSSKVLAHFSPGRVIFLSFFLTIVLGTFLLSLPMARTTEIPLVDLFFTATSATCLTGLFTIPITTDLTMFGQTILMILMQIGGLGVITLSVFFLSIFVNLGFTTQVMTGQLLELESWRGIKELLLFIIAFTFGIEIIGALATYAIISGDYPGIQATFLSCFHAVSAFCNAGITLVDCGTINYGMLYVVNSGLMMVTAALVFIGGVGFVTWREVMYWIMSLRKKKRYLFSLHSKIILYGSISIVLSFALVFWILEHNNTFAGMNPLFAGVHSLFQAVSYRSSGFLSVNVSDFRLPTLLVIMILSFIGSAPGSTGSGIKLTTLAIFLATVKAAIVGHNSVDIKGRRIAIDQIYKAIAIVALSLAWIALTTLCLLITEEGWSFIDIFLETISAFTTIGVTLGVTPSLSFIGKFFIMFTMLIGRMGSLTLVLALKQLAMRKRQKHVGISYPEERVMLS